MIRRDRRVLAALQALLLGLPLFLGGRYPLAVVAAGIVVVTLLVTTARARRDTSDARNGTDAPQTPGVGVLAAFVVLALATTVPLPPVLVRTFSPALAQLTAALLPGWPDAGGWSAWRPLAMHPYGVTTELARIGIGLGAFAVIVAYPWRSEEWGADARAQVFGRLLLTAIAGGALLATLALIEQIAGNGRVLWISDAATQRGRASASFVNPNHLAAWLEMICPVALAYALALSVRLCRRLARAAHAGRGMGVPGRRAWISALIAQQQRLWQPLAVAAITALIIVAHVATGSRGGTAALLAGIVVATAGAAGTLWRDGRGRWLPLVAALALMLGGLAALALFGVADEDQATVERADVSLASRLAVSAAGTGIVRDYPVFGTGLGSWLHAFRPYQHPPVPGGIWDHAHDDYVELAAETGVAGIALALVFAFAVARAARRDDSARSHRGALVVTGGTPPGAGVATTSTDGGAGLPSPEYAGAVTPRASIAPRPPGFEASEWWAALGERSLLRFGLAGGVAAILVHSLVDFGLRLPANLLLLMTVLALLVVSGRRSAAAPAGGALAIAPRSRSVLVIAAALALAIVPQLVNGMRQVTGGVPLSPRDRLEAADLRLAEDGDSATALALVRAALDRNPFDREAHEALASVLAEGPDAEAALRRALVLEPWSAGIRDRLALALRARGERATAAIELEESMRRLPALTAHAYLSPETTLATREPAQLLRSLSDGDTVQLRLANLDREMSAAVERGLAHALDDAQAGPARAAIVDDLATLLEVGERWADAAALLHDESARSAESGTYLARAAHDYLRAHADGPAEETLLAALVQTPDHGDLYRKLAVDVYAARGDFKSADTVLAAAEQNAVDLFPVYRGISEVLARRDAAHVDDLPRPSLAIGAATASAAEEDDATELQGPANGDVAHEPSTQDPVH